MEIAIGSIVKGWGVNFKITKTYLKNTLSLFKTMIPIILRYF
ncbi:hypothetical protein LEP1GSC125_1325 [Leptospira mayottensis 200901122]|uniref:Uncharacterized protein n=1 Tax=Leptospira mayottensis 200901122 TaxID=1193010 RepID=A0AA87MP14_9LEPT|nr:hypothetical protein LEP1GSC125_1325 [Leptospira mayottensis 200901122]